MYRLTNNKSQHGNRDIEFSDTPMRWLIFLILFFPLTTFGQSIPREIVDEAQDKWSYYDSGNPIDGKSKNAIRIKDGLDGETQTLFMLRVSNMGDEVKIKNSTGQGESDRDDVFPFLNTSISINSLEKVQMYFDDDDKYYNINYLKYSEKGLIIFNGISNDDADYLSRFHFIHLLKVKKEVFFRYKFRDSDDVNFSFLLNGSTKAINQAVNLSDFSFDEIGTNFEQIFDSINGYESLNEALDELENEGVISSLNTKREDLFDEIYEYLEEEYGEYVWTFTRLKAIPLSFYLDVNDLNDKTLGKVDLNIFKKKSENLIGKSDSPMGVLFLNLKETIGNIKNIEEFTIRMGSADYRGEIWRQMVKEGFNTILFQDFDKKYSMPRDEKIKFLYSFLRDKQLISSETNLTNFEAISYSEKSSLYIQLMDVCKFISLNFKEFLQSWVD